MTNYHSPTQAGNLGERRKEYLLIKMQIALLLTYTEQEGLHYTGVYLKKALLSLSDQYLDQ
ncbi:MAG: hypothetical protein IPH06_05790 [Alphaproteobacteria bacterium]|jgi:hypothetical protein|nr:hypothetical protein [Alphaproteobacteria bacterium]QQS57530.1 MAG: hypothetical protein IPN28_01555 [Alphaproteobacteria bacterium]